MSTVCALRRLFARLCTWIWPNECRICGGISGNDAIFCQVCFAKITLIDNSACSICGKMLREAAEAGSVCEVHAAWKSAFDVCRALFLYDDASQKIVMKIKRNANSDVAHACCAMLVARHKEVATKADVIVPVPSHWLRLLRRGYNPAFLIVSELSKILKIPTLCALKRVRRTAFQKNKTLNERICNVQDAFSCTADLRGKRIVLVDDVMTSGATLNECAKILKAAGARHVACFVIASTREIAQATYIKTANAQ